MKVCQVALRELESVLPGPNYQVWFGLSRVPPLPGASPEQYITAALGPGAVIRGVAESTGAEMLAEVEWCIRWPGVPGTGPYPEALQSPRFEELVGHVLAYLRHAIAQSTDVINFRSSDVQIMWGFSYLLLGPDGGVVFLGGSYD